MKPTESKLNSYLPVLLVFMVIILISIVQCQYNFSKSIKISTQISAIALSPEKDSKIAVVRVDGFL